MKTAELSSRTRQTAVQQMRAYQLSAPETIVPVSLAIPEPGYGEVLVRMEGCGVCASSLSLWEGRPWFEYPVESGSPGHEGYGTVEKTGPGVENVQHGERVTGLFYRAFADYDIARADQLVRIPETLGELHFPGEPLGCAINIFNRCRIRAGEHVVIVGSGFIGSLLLQLAKSAGARVYAVSRRPYSLKMAESLGADRIIPFNEQASQRIMEITHGVGCSCVIETTGKQQPLDFATRVVCVNGRIVIAGYHQDGLRTVNLQEWNWKGIDVINAHERNPSKYISGISTALEKVSRREINIEQLFTHFFDCENINEAFRIMVDRPEGFVKGIVLFNQN